MTERKLQEEISFLRQQNHDLMEELERTNHDLMEFALVLDAKVEEKTKTIMEINSQLEKRVAQRTHELEVANKELEAFAYSVSHDLRAPLRAIDGFSQAIIEDFSDSFDDTAKLYFERIRKATLNMASLIDDLLELSRITRSEFNVSAIDLVALANETIKLLHLTEPERKYTFLCPERLVVQADLGLMSIALNNLIGNAWKYTSKTERSVIEFGTIEQNGKPLYFIKDNGVGFNNKYVKTLFQPFQRLHPSSEFEGTGVGLATVSRVIQRHNGEIWGEGEEGKGATFFFTLGTRSEVL